MKPYSEHDDPAHDDEFGTLYRAAKFDDEPDPTLDARILEAARRHARSRTQWRRLPLAAAGTLLALALAWQLTPRQVPEPESLELLHADAPASALDASQAETTAMPPALIQAPPAEGPTAFERASLEGPQPLAAPAGPLIEDCRAERESAGAWLACIQRLQTAGSATAADELVAFRAHHPDAELPPGLAELAP